jgi:methyl-accepting chemotaxis protein
MRFSLGTRLLGGVGVILLLMAIVGGLATYNLTKLNDLTATLYNTEFVGVQAVERARIAAEHFRVATILAVSADNETEREQELERRREAEAAFNQEIASLEALLHTAEGSGLLAEIEAAWAQYKAVEDRVVEAALAGNQEQAEQLVHTEGRQRRGELDRLFSRLSEQKNQVAAGTATQAQQTATHARNITLALLIPALLIGIAIALWIRQLVRTIRDSIKRLAATASELLASVRQQEASTTEQAAAVSQTTASIDEIRATAQQSSQQARAVARMAQSATQVAAEGLQTVETTVDGMQDIRARVETIAEQILALSEQTQQVGEIIATVDDLADQSNLLAVNAAIEAARAGEQGRGFAVVAQEVRNLAERSKMATVQVRSILTDIQRATNAAVLATEQGTKGAEEGAKLVDQAGHTIHQLAQTIDQADEAAQQILASTIQQGSGMDQIAEAMSSINQATSETADGTRQLQRATADMNQLARQLNALVDPSKMNGRV